MTLRPYQQQAYDAIMAWVSKCVDPCLIEAATGAGKSHVIAAVANAIYSKSGKRILCLAPKAELVHQNREKYLATGNPASIFSASAGDKSLRHPVVFGTPGTVVNAIDHIAPNVAAVILDETHAALTPTIYQIVDAIRQQNPNVRIIGFTATPYTMRHGYIFDSWPDGTSTDYPETRFFKRMVYRITARELIRDGYLTPPVIGEHDGQYDTSGLEINRTGSYTSASVEQTFTGQGRKTSHIVSDLVARCADRRCVLIFAASRQHAKEILESMPIGTAYIDGNTPKHERQQIISDARSGAVKYIVNVAVLTTGTDIPTIDCVVMMRHTESAGLFQQCIGRGLRLHEDKQDCLILDYAENIETHTPDGDLFNPNVDAPYAKQSGTPIDVACPDCHHVNQFTGRENPDGYGISQDGYFIDLDGHRIEGEYGDMPAHHGRRCTGTRITGGHMVRCSYRWTERTCEECGAGNDIAARYCESCRAELVDPNEKLRMEFARMKADPYQTSTDKVLSWTVQPTMSRAGNPMKKVHYQTEYRKNITQFLPYTSRAKRAQTDYMLWRTKTDDGKTMPETVTYLKDRASGFWRILDYNRPADEISQ